MNRRENIMVAAVPMSKPAAKRGAIVRISTMAIAVATVFYATLRERPAWFVGEVLRSPLGPALEQLRAVTLPFGARLPAFVMDTAPDLLWALALGALLSGLHPRGPARAFWGIAGFLGVLGYELGQRLHVVPGTFDGHDLCAQAAGFAIGWRLAISRLRSARPSDWACSRSRQDPGDATSGSRTT